VVLGQARLLQEQAAGLAALEKQVRPHETNVKMDSGPSMRHLHSRNSNARVHSARARAQVAELQRTFTSALVTFEQRHWSALLGNEQRITNRVEQVWRAATPVPCHARSACSWATHQSITGMQCFHIHCLAVFCILVCVCLRVRRS
jgi:hypothetical protein